MLFIQNKWGKILGILSLVIFIQGCVPTAFIAGTASGVVIYDHRSTKTMVDDREITFRIQHYLDNDQELHDTAHVSVTSFNHVVLLLGQTPSEELRERTESIAKAIKKVKIVYNEIAIGEPISKMQCANDTWITTKVKTVLVTTAKLHSATLKVITENSVVYLLGLTTRSQARLAADAVRTVAGVRKVVKLFEFID